VTSAEEIQLCRICGAEFLAEPVAGSIKDHVRSTAPNIFRLTRISDTSNDAPNVFIDVVTQNALCGTQSLEDTIAQQLLEQLRARRPNADRLFQAPSEVMSEEQLCLRRQVLAHRAPGGGATCPHMSGGQIMILEDRDGGVGGAQPQALTHETERHGVQTLLELHVAVAMDTDLSPDTQVRSHRGQFLHQRSLERKTRQWLFACRAVDAKAGFLQHSIPTLGVQVRQIAELTQGKEVTLYILNARLDDPLFGRICRWTASIRKP